MTFDTSLNPAKRAVPFEVTYNILRFSCRRRNESAARVSPNASGIGIIKGKFSDRADRADDNVDEPLDKSSQKR